MPIRIRCTKCGTPLAVSRELLDAIPSDDAKIVCHHCGAPTSLERSDPVVPNHEPESPEVDEEFDDRPTLRIEPETLESQPSRASDPPLGSDPDNRITLAYVSGPGSEEPEASPLDSAKPNAAKQDTPQDGAQPSDSCSGDPTGTAPIPAAASEAPEGSSRESASSETAGNRPKDAVETEASDSPLTHPDVEEPAPTSRRAQVTSSPSFFPPAEKSQSRPEKWVLLAFLASVAAWCAFEGTPSRTEGPAATHTSVAPSEAVSAAAKPAAHAAPAASLRSTARSATDEPPSAGATTPRPSKQGVTTPPVEPERVTPGAGRDEATAPSTERIIERSFDTDAARASLNEAALAAATCRTRGDPPGRTEVAVTFDPSGQAESARIYAGIYLHTNTARCVVKKMLEARAPAFSGASVVLHHPVVVY